MTFKTIPYQYVEQMYDELKMVQRLCLYNWYVTTQLYNRAIETTTLLKGKSKLNDSALYKILPYEEFLQTKGKELFHWYLADLFSNYEEFRHLEIKQDNVWVYWEDSVKAFYVETADMAIKEFAQNALTVGKIKKPLLAKWIYNPSQHYNTIEHYTDGIVKYSNNQLQTKSGYVFTLTPEQQVELNCQYNDVLDHYRRPKELQANMRLKTAIALFHTNVKESLAGNKPFEFIRCKPTECPYQCIKGIKWDNLSLVDDRLTVANGHVFKLSLQQENELSIARANFTFKVSKT